MISYPARAKFILSVLVLAFSAFWIWTSRQIGSAAGPEAVFAPQEGFLAPPFSLESLSGEDYDLTNSAGRPVILNYWASWCPPCRAEMPSFQSIAQEYSNSDLVILAVNASYQDSLAEVIAFTDAYQLTFPILLDTSGSVSRSYNVHALPTTFFISADGVINRIIIGGPLPVSLLRIEITRLLQEHP